MMKNNTSLFIKKIVYIVAHTHWDREWYFTDATSEILLNKLFNDLNRKENIKFTLDGQASLLESFIKINNDLDSNFINKIKNNIVTIGPLYIQNDTFNVMFGTTQNNIDIGRKITEKFSKPSLTMYMPDSFGFNEQLPQIFKKNGFKNFVAWRGMKVEDRNKSNLLYWVGIDGTKIRTSIMADGYAILGEAYPYNFSNNSFSDIVKFEKHLIKKINILEKRSNENVYWLPLGGDQAPYEFNLNSIIKKINERNNEYKFILGNHDDYFKVIKKSELPEITYPLYYSGNSKIHRTISSNRYDIKHLFRKIEFLLYYQIEQFEIMYKMYKGKIIGENFKNEHFYKPLLKSSAHDSLGGCNSDLTNSLILARLNHVYSAATSYMDSMVRDVKENLNIGKDEYIIFNHAPFKQSLLFIDNISRSNNNSLTTTDKNACVIDYKISDFSFKYHNPVFNHKIVISAKNMEPFSYKIIKLTESKITKYEQSIVNFNDEFIVILHQNKKIKFRILIEDDFGDEYDFSSSELSVMEYFSKYSIKNSYKEEELVVIDFVGKNKTNVINFSLIKNKDKIIIKISTINKLKNKKISMVFKSKNVKLSRHLAIVDQELDNIENWKEIGYKDNPINSFTNDGFVGLNNGLGLYTKGTNEVVIEDGNVKLTLARFVGYLGRPQLNYRPGVASGLAFKVHVPNAQLQKKLLFTVGMTFGNKIKNLNEWYFQGFGSLGSHTNSWNKSLDNFIINKSELEIVSINDMPIINKNKLLIGQYKIVGNSLSTILANPISKKYLDYKKYEIKFIKYLNFF